MSFTSCDSDYISFCAIPLIRPAFSPACGTAGPALREKLQRVCGRLHRGAGGAPGADRQLLLLQREVRQSGRSVGWAGGLGRSDAANICPNEFSKNELKFSVMILDCGRGF